MTGVEISTRETSRWFKAARIAVFGLTLHSAVAVLATLSAAVRQPDELEYALFGGGGLLGILLSFYLLLSLRRA